MRRIIAVFLSVVLAFSLRAADYYVSGVNASRSDSNAGTSTSLPWATIAKANAKYADGTIGPGDNVYVDRSGDIAGNLLCAPTTSPANEGQRMFVSSYGSGSGAILQGTGGAGVEVRDCSYVTVSNLIFVGPGINSSGTYPTRTTSTTSTGASILFSTTSSTVPRVGLTATGNVMSGSLAGVAFKSSLLKPTVSFDQYTVTNNFLDLTGIYGIGVWGSSFFEDSGSGPWGKYNSNGYIAGNRITNTLGITAFTQGGVETQTGFGIVHCFGTDLVMERNYIDDTGSGSSTTSQGGPTAILTLQCARVTIRANKVARSHAPNNIDASGIDHDGDCVDVVSEYNWIQDCDGPAFQIYGAGTHSGNVIRYNITQNNGLRGASAGGRVASALGIYGGATPKIYNNTFYHYYTGSGTNVLIAADSADYANNIFAIENGATYGSLAATSTVVGNTYNTRAGSSFSITINGATYTTLAGLHGGGLEKNGGIDYGASGDAVFTNAGNGGAGLPSAQIETLSAYDISGASAAHNAGINLATWGVTAPVLDFHGNTALSGVDSGAVRYGSTYAVQPSGSPVFFRRRF